MKLLPSALLRRRRATARRHQVFGRFRRCRRVFRLPRHLAREGVEPCRVPGSREIPTSRSMLIVIIVGALPNLLATSTARCRSIFGVNARDVRCRVSQHGLGRFDVKLPANPRRRAVPQLVRRPAMIAPPLRDGLRDRRRCSQAPGTRDRKHDGSHGGSWATSYLSPGDRFGRRLTIRARHVAAR